MLTTVRGDRSKSIVLLLVLALPAAANASSSGDSPPQPTTAQIGSADSQSGLAEIVVTAEKRTERLQDVPMSVSVISGERLTATQSTTLQDIVDAVPGMQ